MLFNSDLTVIPFFSERRWVVLLALLIGISTDSVAGRCGAGQPGLTEPTIIPCQIQVVDRQNRWPVPLVELRTVHGVRFVSDNAGLIAFDLPESMGVPTWFHVLGHGYDVAADGFGYRGVRLIPKPGETLTVELDRQFPGKRLGRLTGAGLFAESQKLGLSRQWTEQRIMGCDSVQIARHGDRLFWAWGDTQLAGYPLGRFHMIGATTELRPLDAWQPPIQLRFDYWTDDEGIPRNICEMPGEGPTWLNGLVSLLDNEGQSHLVATYTKIQPPLDAYEIGLCEWDGKAKRFRQTKVLWKRSEQSPTPPPTPQGHSTFVTDPHGQSTVVFGDPFPSLRCAATYEAWADPDQWEALTPVSTVATLDGKRSIKPHRGSIAWNRFRQRWITVFTQFNGDSSYLGEIWYAEADSPTGPWGGAVKVVTHDKYTFYNPRLHTELMQDDDSVLLLEATYTKEFSGNSVATPRYDYNQILYRVDLDDPQLRAN